MSLRPTPRHRIVVALIAAIVAWLVPTAASAAERLVLAVTIDGDEQPDPVLAEERDGHLYLRSTDVAAVARWTDPATGEADLDRVAGLRYVLDRGLQSLAITLPAAARPRRHRRDLDAPVELTPNGWGAFLNYDAVASEADGSTALDAAVDMHVFSPRLVATNAFLLHAGTGQARQQGFVRLDSNVSMPDLARNRRWTVGDFITGGTTTSRPVRLGGIQLTTDFGLRPDLITFPVPDIGDQAAVPTTADLVVDSVRRSERPPAAGDFTTATRPVTTGVNDVQVTTRDVLGRETVRSLSFYASRALLLPGLSAISLEAGFARTGYGSVSDRYRAPAVAGTWRRGISQTLTLEAHGEATRGVATIGGGGTLGLGAFGAAYLAVAHSRGRVFDRAGGTQFAIGWERLARPVSMSAQYVRSSRGFADIAARYATAVRRSTLITNIGFDLARAGTLSAAYLRLGRGQERLGPGITALDDVPLLDNALAARSRQLGRLSLASVTYAVPILRRFSFIANVTRAVGATRDISATAGVLVMLGTRTSAQASADIRDEGTSARIAAARPAVMPGDIGFRADLSTGAIDRQAAEVDYIGTRGRIQAAVERTGGATAVRASAQGSLIVAPEGAFVADRIDGSFAIVDAGGERGVPVFRDNRPAGVTGRRGYAVVTGLLPYQANKLSLDPDALADDAVIPSAERLIRPREQSGAVVSFGIRRTSGRVLRLVDERGAPIPAGARASIAAREPIPVGMDGEIYLMGAAPGDDGEVRVGTGGHCTFTLRAVDLVRGQLPRTLTCRHTALYSERASGPATPRSALPDRRGDIAVLGP